MLSIFGVTVVVYYIWVKSGRIAGFYRIRRFKTNLKKHHQSNHLGCYKTEKWVKTTDQYSHVFVTFFKVKSLCITISELVSLYNIFVSQYQTLLNGSGLLLKK